MAVDHGLGGRNNQKSELRREKKSKQLKKLVKRLNPENSKKEIKFDENSRQEFLTGFHKRKQERRKFGLAMEILKTKRARKENIKSRNSVLSKGVEEDKHSRKIQEFLEEANQGRNFDDEDDEENTKEEPTQQVQMFMDEATKNMFGGYVSVTVNDEVALTNKQQLLIDAVKDSDAEEDDNDSDDEDDDNKKSDKRENPAKRSTTSTSVSSRYPHNSNNSNSLKRKKRELSNFDRAMLKAKQTMGTKKKKRRLNSSQDQRPGQNKISSYKSKAESKKLLTKVIGKGNGFKTKKGPGGRR